MSPRYEGMLAVELVANAAPGVAGGVVDDPDQEEGESAGLGVGADAVFLVVEDGARAEVALHIRPAAFDGKEPLGGRGKSLNAQRRVSNWAPSGKAHRGARSSAGRAPGAWPGLGWSGGVRMCLFVAVGHRILCSAREPVRQHGGGGLHGNRGMLPSSTRVRLLNIPALPATSTRVSSCERKVAGH
jgi:hypothetical protein